jgi:hypothetical protein
LAPLLREHGFSGSGVTFRRHSGEVIQLLHIQGSRSGGSFCVNLGLHLAFLPTVRGDTPDPRKITESLCEFRKRLAPEGQSDYWWNYGADARDAASSVDHLVNVTLQVGLPHFERFRYFPGPFDGITPQILAAGDFTMLPGNVTAAGGALAMARISAHLGRRERAREFAAVGLASLGPSAIMGMGIARQLAALAGARE